MKARKARAISTLSSFLLAGAASIVITVTGYAQSHWPVIPNAVAQMLQREADNRTPTGSAIFYSFYTSSPTDADHEETFFSLTNRHATQAALIRLLFVNSRNLEAEEYTLCLPANQTVHWRASELDPGITGHVFAIASDATGRPLQFNWLTGVCGVKNGAADAVTWQNAVTLAKHTSGVVLPINQSASLLFDGTDYDRLPEQFAKYLADSRLSLEVSAINCPGKPAFIFKQRELHTLTRRQ